MAAGHRNPRGAEHRGDHYVKIDRRTSLDRLQACCNWEISVAVVNRRDNLELTCPAHEENPMNTRSTPRNTLLAGIFVLLATMILGTVVVAVPAADAPQSKHVVGQRKRGWTTWARKDAVIPDSGQRTMCSLWASVDVQARSVGRQLRGAQILTGSWSTKVQRASLSHRRSSSRVGTNSMSTASMRLPSGATWSVGPPSASSAKTRTFRTCRPRRSEQARSRTK